MDQETLTNHIIHLSKVKFDITCKLVLQEIFHLNAINVDGTGDGGSDMTAFQKDGSRTNVAYQITVQKKDIERKVYQDARKSIDKLRAERFYFITTVNLSETEARKIESNITKELGIQAICFGAKHIAAFLLDEGLLNRFLDELNYPLPRDVAQSPDYREMALHAYTLMSKDANNMRSGIYDDTILFIASAHDELKMNDLVDKVIKTLGVDSHKVELINRRIDALFGRKALVRRHNEFLAISETAKNDLSSRKRIYEQELTDLSAAQVDMIRTDYGIDWTIEDSKSISVFIADIYISEQIKTLKEIKASIIISPFFNYDDRGLKNLKKYLLEKKLPKKELDVAIEKLLLIAANHPLINKLARASVYVALEGANPIVSAKALGAARWSDYSILVEPSVAIPWICSQLYAGAVNRSFDASIHAVKRTKELNAPLYITYYYINECASHLLRAREYDGLDFNPEELRFSSNAYISNYYSLKGQGIKVPGSVLEYLRTFSPAVLVSSLDIKAWIRNIMTDLQGILTKSGIEFVDTPKYEHEDCAAIEKEYAHLITSRKINKPSNLIEHDVWAIQFTHDKVINKHEHWLILTCDKSLVAMGESGVYSGWIATPNRFLSLTENYKPLPEAQYVSLIHSFASYSERTLSAGARIIDKIVHYASAEMQNWEFRQELDRFKRDVVEQTDLESPTAYNEIDSKADSFLTKHGIKVQVEHKQDAEDNQ